MSYAVSTSLFAGTAVGVFIITSVVWRLLKHGELSWRALTFGLLGFVFVGLSIWKSIRLDMKSLHVELKAKEEELQQSREANLDEYKYFIRYTRELEGIVVSLRRENLLLRTASMSAESPRQIPKTYPGSKTYLGRVTDSKGRPLSDVRVVEAGGSQVFSNVNGEFYLSTQVGRTVRLEKGGYSSSSITMTLAQFGPVQTTVLQREGG